jgi:hypothetical protein
MGGACGTHGRDENKYRILVRKPERDHFGDIGLDGMIILKWILKDRI